MTKQQVNINSKKHKDLIELHKAFVESFCFCFFRYFLTRCREYSRLLFFSSCNPNCMRFFRKLLIPALFLLHRTKTGHICTHKVVYIHLRYLRSRGHRTQCLTTQSSTPCRCAIGKRLGFNSLQ